MCLLFNSIPGASRQEEYLIHTLCVATIWAIALQWKAMAVPFSLIIDRVDSIMLMERIHHMLFDTMHLFDAKWNAWKPSCSSFQS